MTKSAVTCPMCGYGFGANDRRACESCPVNSGCKLLCCPNCGHNTIDPNDSRAARGLMRLLRWRPGAASPPPGLPEPAQSSGEARPNHATLRDLPPGSRARVCEYASRTPARCREALTSYGLCPGQWLCVRRTSPVTVIEVDQLELALEQELAQWIEIDQLECPLLQEEWSQAPTTEHSTGEG